MAKVSQKWKVRQPGKGIEEICLYDSTKGMDEGYIPIKESYTTVADILERNNMPVNSACIGQIVYVTSEDKYYKLSSVPAGTLFYPTSSSNWTQYNYTGETYYAALSLTQKDKSSSVRVLHNGVLKYVYSEFTVVP